jgi:hypothetical protein
MLNPNDIGATGESPYVDYRELMSTYKSIGQPLNRKILASKTTSAMASPNGSSHPLPELGLSAKMEMNVKSQHINQAE